MYRCNVCKVSLCKTPKTKSNNDKTCFTIWQSSIDLIVENNKIKAVLWKKPYLDERSTNDKNPQLMETTIHIMIKRDMMITVSPEKRKHKLVSQMDTIMKRKM